VIFLHVLLYNCYRQPLSKYSLRYDKLLVDKDVYVFNELSGTVEQVGGGIQEEMDLTASSSPTTPYRSPFNRNVSREFHSFKVKNSPSTINPDLKKNLYYTKTLNIHSQRRGACDLNDYLSKVVKCSYFLARPWVKNIINNFKFIFAE
jgi:hypothetical protein